MFQTARCTIRVRRSFRYAHLTKYKQFLILILEIGESASEGEWARSLRIPTCWNLTLGESAPLNSLMQPLHFQYVYSLEGAGSSREVAVVASELFGSMYSDGQIYYCQTSVSHKPGFSTRRHKMSIAPHRHCRQMLWGFEQTFRWNVMVASFQAKKRFIVWLFAYFLLHSYESFWVLLRHRRTGMLTFEIGQVNNTPYLPLPRRYLCLICPRTSSVPH